jgi:biotin carboxylase
MRVVFLAPQYPPEMIEYTRGLAEVGAEVFGVGDTPRHALPARLKPYLHDYLHVPHIMDENDVMDRVSAWLRGRSVDRVLSNWEPLVILAARLRERWGVPGMSVDTVRGFRDKQLMKERVAAAGLRVPKSRRARSANEVRAVADEFGYPLIVKPIAGAGSADTYKVENGTDLEATLRRMGHIEETICEEYIDGEEFTFDTVCINGTPAYENICAYLPNALEMRSVEAVSPIMLSFRDMTQAKLAPGIELGRDVLRALGMDSGFTHMEWFLTSRDEAVFGEIACRPGGAHIVDQMNYTSDIDLFREWARVACWGVFEGNASRKYNVGVVFKRAHGEGRISHIEGLDGFRQMAGSTFVEETLLRHGTPRRNWKQTLLSDGHIIVRHPEWQEALRLSQAAATAVQLYAS